jgi:hypothetical protein
MRRAFLTGALAAILAALTLSAVAQMPAVAERESHAIGVEAYLYFYPLVTMDITQRQLTNIEPEKIPGR